MKRSSLNHKLALTVLASFATASLLHAADSQGNSEDNSGKSASSQVQSGDNSQGGDSSSKSQSENNNGDGESQAQVGTPDPFQAKADPYNLPKAGTVMQAGSTAASKTFDTTVMPSLMQFIQKNLPETVNNSKSIAYQIDPSKLSVAVTHDITATFVYENAGYHNSVGVNVLGADQSQPKTAWDEVTSPTAKLLFGDASNPAGGAATIGDNNRTQDQPVSPGDFVDMGTVKAGSKLDFFLISNGANGGNNVFSTQEALNQDGYTKHVAEFTPTLFAVPQLNSPYVFLAFEDLWGGGDKDVNDTIIAINLGAANVKSLLATPEPAMPLTFGACLGLAFFAVRKNRQATANA